MEMQRAFSAASDKPPDKPPLAADTEEEDRTTMQMDFCNDVPVPEMDLDKDL